MTSWRNGWHPSPRAEWDVRDPRGVIRQWLGQDHPKAVVDAVAFWLASVEVDGPPFDGVRVFPDDDLFMARIPATDVAVSYRITEYEFRIALDSIE